MGGLSERSLRHRFGDEPDFIHGHEDGLRASLGAIRVATGREPRWRFDETSQHRCLGDPHLTGRLAKIALGRSIDAVGAGTEINAIEVKLENLSFAEFAF